MRWQDILTYSSGGTITLFLLFAGIFNLSGITYSSSGDSYVDNGVAYAYINISSTYWKLCFEHGKDKEVIYAKSSRSQTRYINLDKIVFSNPPVEIDLQRSYFSGWKNVDEGYCIERTNVRKVNQFRLVGHNIKQTTKWNFVADYWLMKDVNIDPYWLVAGDILTYQENTIIKQCDEIIYEGIEILRENITLSYIENTTGKNITKIIGEKWIGDKIINKTRCITNGKIEIQGKTNKIYSDENYFCDFKNGCVICISRFDGSCAAGNCNFDRLVDGEKYIKECYNKDGILSSIIQK